MAVFGVDFGNIASVVSIAQRGGVDVIVNDVSKRETASLVSFGEKERYLGEKALDQSIRNWKNTIGNIKRLIGVHFDSDLARHERKFMKNEMRRDANGLIEIRVMYKWEEQWYKPEQLVGMLFTKLREMVENEAAIEAKLDPKAVKVTDCVVSVPCYFTSTQRRLLYQGLQIAGLNPLNIINETTAAALDWGIFKSTSLPDKEEEAIVTCFVDIGHCGTTITIASFMKTGLKVLGHLFDRFLGCRDFQAALLDHFTAEVQKKYNCDLGEDRKGALKLASACEKLQKVLSANAAASLSCEMSEFDVQFPKVVREEVEELWRPLAERMRALVQRAQSMPGADKISAVEVLGGGSRIPLVKQILSEGFGKQLSSTLNASESVAKGCGIMGAMLSPKFKVRDYSVVDANVYTINLGYYSDKSSTPISDPNFPEINKKMVVLKPGDACPKTLNLTFDRSQNFDLFVFYEQVEDITTAGPELTIGKWKVSAIPQLPEQPSVKVRLRLSPSMLVNVEGATVTEEYEVEEEVEVEKPKEETKKEEPADDKKKEGDDKADMETDAKAEPAKAEPAKEKKLMKKKKTRKHDCTVTVLASTGNPQERLNDMRNLELTMIASDTNVRDTLESKNSVEAYIYDMRGKLASGGVYAEYITEADQAAFSTASTDIEDWLYGDGEEAAKDDYVQKLSDLKKFGGPAERRFKAFQAIPAAVTAFDAKVKELHAKAQNTDGTLAHLPAEELQSVMTKCEEFKQWLATETSKNAAAPKTQDPPLGAAAVTTKQTELEKFCNPILTKPKPKEEKKETPPPAESEAAPAEAAAAPEGEKPAEGEKPGNKMDLD